MRILVSGASGLIGTALCSFLSESGHSILRLVRNPARVAEDAVYWRPEADLMQDAGRLEGIEAVINLAGSPVAGARWNRRVKADVRSSRIRGTRLLASVCAGLKRKPSVFLSASATGFYGDRGDDELTESSPAGGGFLASVVKDWEMVTSPASLHGIRVATMRIGMVLSPDGGAMAKMLLPFRLGLGGRFGSGRQFYSWVHIRDLCRATEFLLLHDDISGPVNFVSPSPVTNAELTRSLARAVHRPAFMHMPALAARVLIGEMADELLLASAKVIPKKLVDAGFAFEFPELAAALRALLNN
ncbi:MAG: TIGR01777 family oxidoreductase [Verrucomicrobia bacterium]|nr:TIGR01777 family oxidoreductase [Verrucomicrobiota bacterium]